MFCRSLFLLLSFFFWPFCCLSFFQLTDSDYSFGIFKPFLPYILKPVKQNATRINPVTSTLCTPFPLQLSKNTLCICICMYCPVLKNRNVIVFYLKHHCDMKINNKDPTALGPFSRDKFNSSLS